MFWMRAYTLRGEVGGGWALEFPSFLGPVKWERADRQNMHEAVYINHRCINSYILQALFQSSPVLRNRNYFLRFRFRLLKSYGSGFYFWKVTVLVPVPAPDLYHKKQIFL